jgi:hypothetical protein
MNNIHGCIHYWESVLLANRFILASSTTALLEQTIENLKELATHYTDIEM